jgi:hypothetical protein
MRSSDGGKSSGSPAFGFLFALRGLGRCARNGFGVYVVINFVTGNLGHPLERDDVLGGHSGFVNPMLDRLKGNAAGIAHFLFAARLCDGPPDVFAPDFDIHARDCMPIIFARVKYFYTPC